VRRIGDHADGAWLRLPVQWIAMMRTWAPRIGIAVTLTGSALILTALWWPFLARTPFVILFVAAILSARLGGRAPGLIAVGLGLAGSIWFLPPWDFSHLPQLLVGFAVFSGGSAWLVGRHQEIVCDLRTSRERLAFLVASLPALVWAIDRNGYVTFADGRGIEGVGLTPAKLIGRTFFEVYRNAPDMLASTRRVLDGETFTARATVDGFEIETSHSPVRSDRETVIGALGVSVDVTGRLVLERRYRDTQKMEAVGRLAAGVAHDFNNLLIAIGGYAELVMDSLDPADERQSYLLEVRKAADRAAALTRQLLAFSRRQVLQPMLVDVNLLVGDLQKFLRRTLGADIDLVMNLQPQLDPVRIDPAQLEHALINLAVNARDAMLAGGQLRFATDMVDVTETFAVRKPPMKPGRYVHILVSDTGVGMPPEVQARIFDPFFTTKPPGQGTGLGLATVYGVVKQSDGFIWVDSTVGEGTAFSIYLPAVRGTIEPAAATRAPASEGGQETILIVEDDGAVRALMRQILGRAGYTVLEARDGDEALTVARVQQSRIDLVVTDIVMPGLGGRALAARLTADRPLLRVLYTSGYATDAMLRDDDGSSLPFLAKPFLPLELVRKVRETLDAAGPPST
jgi:two-component system cell cycle sensor histidine kinase/response regulator CckA